MPAVVRAETSAQARMRATGQAFRVYTPTRRKDHNGQLYSLNKVFLDQYLVHPFGRHDDLIDAVSRIYDMEPVPPIVIDESILEPEIYEDGI